MPDPVLLHLTWALTPPTDPDMRADIVRLAMSRFAQRRHYGRLACLFYSADIDALKSLLLALSDSPVGDGMMNLETSVYQRSLKEVSLAWLDETFVRLASVASDTLDWDEETFAGPGSDAWTRYVLPAWLVLTDEIEFENEIRAGEIEELRSCSDSQYWRDEHGAYSRNEARSLAESDRRLWSRMCDKELK